MEIKNLIREMMKRHCQQRGTTLSAVARSLDMSRQAVWDLLAEPVSEVGLAVCRHILEADRAGLEQRILAEWRRAIDAGCDVVPPRLTWETLVPDFAARALVPDALLWQAMQERAAVEIEGMVPVDLPEEHTETETKAKRPGGRRER